MLKKQILICLMATFGFLHIGSASAVATLSFDPSNQTVGLGDSVTVDLRISGLGDDILTAFDLDISFDDSILDFQGFTFGTGLDTFGLGTNIQFDTDFGAGLVNVYEISFDSDVVLGSFQPNDFVLGTFDFGTLSLGTSALNVAAPLFGGLVGAGALELDMEVVEGSVSVVPVPAAIWLFGSALMGLIGLSRRTSTA